MPDGSDIGSTAQARLIARHCLDQAGGYRAPALEMMIERMNASPRLKEQIAEDLLREHYRYLIAQAAHEMNQRIKARESRSDAEYHRGFGGHNSDDNRAQVAATADRAIGQMSPEGGLPDQPPTWTPPPTEGAGMMARARNNETIYDLEIWGAIKLGDATGHDIIKDRDQRKSRIEGDRSRMAFDDAILKRYRERKQEYTIRVDQVLSRDELRTLGKITGVLA